MTTLDPERQKQAKVYARIKRRLWLVDLAVSAIYMLAWLFFGWAVALRNWLTHWSLVTYCRIRGVFLWHLLSAQPAAGLLHRLYPPTPLRPVHADAERLGDR